MRKTKMMLLGVLLASASASWAAPASGIEQYAMKEFTADFTQFHIGDTVPAMYLTPEYNIKQWQLRNLPAPDAGSHWTYMGGNYVLITDTEGASAIFPGGYVTYLNETKVLVGVDPSVIEIHGVYSPECAEAMARTVQENLHTAIAIGITGTTGNLDPNNADSVQGVVYFCILYKAQAHTFTFQTNVSGMTRHEIKQLYAEQVFAELEMILTSSL